MTSELLDQELSLEELELITGAGIREWVKEKYEEVKEAVMGPDGSKPEGTTGPTYGEGVHPLRPRPASMQYTQPDDGGDPWGMGPCR